MNFALFDLIISRKEKDKHAGRRRTRTRNQERSDGTFRYGLMGLHAQKSFVRAGETWCGRWLGPRWWIPPAVAEADYLPLTEENNIEKLSLQVSSFESVRSA
eukprot:scaffold293_cov248-Pinguiococcus_pyrenoidosus.AAC.5